MGDPSIHDNFVTGYQVDIEAKLFRLRTQFRDNELTQITDVVFEGIEGYLFLDGLGGIVTDIMETTIDKILDQYAAYFERGEKYGWPGVWNRDRESVEIFVHEKDLKVFEITSAIGFDGFVFAKCMRKELVS